MEWSPHGLIALVYGSIWTAYHHVPGLHDNYMCVHARMPCGGATVGLPQDTGLLIKLDAAHASSLHDEQTQERPVAMAMVNGELTHIVAAMETAESLPCLQGAVLTFQLLLPQEDKCHCFRKTPREKQLTCPSPIVSLSAGLTFSGARYQLLPLEVRPHRPQKPREAGSHMFRLRVPLSVW